MKKTKQLTILTGDFLLLNLSLYLTLVIRYRLIGLTEQNFSLIWQAHQQAFLLVFLLWLLCFYLNGLYWPNLLANGRHFNLVALKSMALASALSIAYFYLRPDNDITPKTNLFIFIFIFSILFFIWRRFFNLLLKSYLPKNRVLFVGHSRHFAALQEELSKNPQLGWKNEGIISLENISQLPKIVKEKNIQTIVLGAGLENEEAQTALFSCLDRAVNFFPFPHFYEQVSGKIPVEEISKSWFLENLSRGGKKFYYFTKKILDFSGSLVGFSLSLPFWPLIALAIYLNDPGSVFFKQERVGRDGKIFYIYKFRSMRTENNNFTMTTEGDSRITKVGNFLRKSRLDEIPQLINILQGEMSFIGPRPERPEFVNQLAEKIPFYKTRLLIKPGLTGWDQVSGKYHSPSFEDSLEKLQYDLFYLKHQSFYLDLVIILKTIATIISRGGR